MGKDAEWTLHTILGQPLSFHWMETDEAGCNSEGQPSAKSMIKLKPWTHIILQEQTDRPRVEYEDFRESVGKWVDFIRNNCPNPHAAVSYTHLRAHETVLDLVCRLLLEKNFFNDTATTEIYTV